MVRRTLKITKAELLAPWRSEQNNGREAKTQAIGRLTRKAGLQAIIFSSAVLTGGKNVVIFPDRITLRNEVTIMAESILLKHIKRPRG